MKILVTGGAGFIGSQIADAYLQEGHDVTVVDNLSTGKDIPVRARLVRLDIRDPDLDTLFAKSKFEIVNHHAAQIDVIRSTKDPSFDASVNISGTLRLLQCCRTHGVRKFIFASSGGAIYGECERPALESDPCHPESPYGISKAAAENYIRFFGSHHHLPYTILRYANVYGPRQDPNGQGEAGVVSVFIRKLLADEAVTIYGNGRQERDYVFVGDVVAANLAALTKGENDTYNIATQTAVSVNILIEKLSGIRRLPQPPIHAPARMGEVHRSVLNASLALERLGWRPTHSLEQGLEETWRYFQQTAKNETVRS